MSKYTIEVERKAISYGTAAFEVEANSKAEARRMFYQGDATEVEEYINKSENSDTIASIELEIKIEVKI